MDILTQNSQQTIAVIDPEKSYSYFIAQELFIEGFEIVTFDNADDCELFANKMISIWRSY